MKARTPYDTVVVSGGFDPVHVGHVRMITEAAKYGDVIVVANSDDWLENKKGYIFVKVERVDDTDGTVCEALKRLKPTYFANGGDRQDTNTPEMHVCKKLGIELLWNIGGGKIQSSSSLVEKQKSNYDGV